MGVYMDTNINDIINQRLEKTGQTSLKYVGRNLEYYGKVGKLLPQFDENCCAPTQEMRYTFEGEDLFWMMTAEELLGEIDNFVTA